MIYLFWALCGLAACGLAYWLAHPLLQPDGTDDGAAAEQKIAKQSATAILLALPLLALGTYLYLGNPTMPDEPLAPRLDGALEDLPPAAILARLENELRQRPNDAQGWRLLARLQVTLGRHEKAANAWQRLLDITDTDVEAQVGLAAALIQQQDGVVDEVSVALLDAALAQDANNLQAQFWRAEAWQQQGRPDEARKLWRQLRARLPDAAPLAKMLDNRLTEKRAR